MRAVGVERRRPSLRMDIRGGGEGGARRLAWRLPGGARWAGRSRARIQGTEIPRGRPGDSDVMGFEGRGDLGSPSSSHGNGMDLLARGKLDAADSASTRGANVR